MPIQVNDTLPDMPLTVVDTHGQSKKSVKEVLGTGKVVLFAVPGAYTPTCSAQHLPSFVKNLDALKAKGVDTVACMSVNDAFVMEAWGKDGGAVEPGIVMVADHDAAFSKALDLTFDGSAFGLGVRSQRFALIAEDGVVTQLFVEEGGGYEVSSAENVLRHL